MAPKTKEAIKGGDIGVSTNQAELAARVLLMEENLDNFIKSEAERRKAEAKAEAARQAAAVTRQKTLEKQLADAVQKLNAATEQTAAAAAIPAQDAARISNLEEAQKCHTQLLVKLHKRIEQLSKHRLAKRLIVWWYGWGADGWEPPG